METEFVYPFDYALYTPEEIASLIKMVHYFEHVKDPHKDKEKILIYYQAYQSIINNQAEEKRLDAVFKKELGFSIYALIKKVRSL